VKGPELQSINQSINKTNKSDYGKIDIFKQKEAYLKEYSINKPLMNRNHKNIYFE
jgi:hypothetical protein